MQRLLLLSLFITSYLTASAQLTNQQIAGNWKIIIKQGERIVEVRAWSFSKEGNGSYSMNSDVRNRACATSEYFTYRIQGNNIFITPTSREKGCNEKKDGDEEVIKNKVKAEPYTLQLQLETTDRLILGGTVFIKY